MIEKVWVVTSGYVHFNSTLTQGARLSAESAETFAAECRAHIARVSNLRTPWQGGERSRYDAHDKKTWENDGHYVCIEAIDVQEPTDTTLQTLQAYDLLKRFLTHEPTCAHTVKYGAGPDDTCTCGLVAALTSILNAPAQKPAPPAPVCAKCRQPEAHPFHAPKGLFGRELETHVFVAES